MPLPEGYDNKASVHTPDQQGESVVNIEAYMFGFLSYSSYIFYVLTCRGEFY